MKCSETFIHSGNEQYDWKGITPILDVSFSTSQSGCVNSKGNGLKASPLSSPHKLGDYIPVFVHLNKARMRMMKFVTTTSSKEESQLKERAAAIYSRPAWASNFQKLMTEQGSACK